MMESFSEDRLLDGSDLPTFGEFANSIGIKKPKGLVTDANIGAAAKIRPGEVRVTDYCKWVEREYGRASQTFSVGDRVIVRVPLKLRWNVFSRSPRWPRQASGVAVLPGGTELEMLGDVRPFSFLAWLRIVDGRDLEDVILGTSIRSDKRFIELRFKVLKIHLESWFSGSSDFNGV
jgi:hypothetical protein